MSEVTELSNANKQKLVSDMKVVVADAEEILRATAGVAGEKMGDLRERIGERLRDAKLRLADAEAALVDRTKAAALSLIHISIQLTKSLPERDCSRLPTPAPWND